MRACVCVGCVRAHTANARTSTTSASTIGTFERRCARPLSSLRAHYDRGPRPIRIFHALLRSSLSLSLSVSRYRTLFCLAGDRRNSRTPAANLPGRVAEIGRSERSMTGDFGAPLRSIPTSGYRGYYGPPWCSPVT